MNRESQGNTSLSPWNYKGFTLAEMAIVVLIGSIMLTMGVKIWFVQLTNMAYSETKSKQENIKTALINYLRTTGTLPCPDRTATPDGREDRPNGTAPNTTCTGNNGYGVVPYASLGLSRNDVLDGWGNYFTYRVANMAAPAAPATPAVPRANASNQNWTVRAGASAFNITSLNSPNTGGFRSLRIDQRNSAGVLTRIAYNAVAIIYSHGKNGFGAETTKGNSVAAPPATNTDEVTNNAAGSFTFVVRDVNDSATALGGSYDDIVMFLTPKDVLQPLIDEGTLKTCSFYCPSAISAACTAGGGTCTCSAEGVLGTPVLPCTVCGTCTKPLVVGCSATNIPVGTTTVTCP